MRSLLLAATVALALAACGSEERGVSEPSLTSPTLESWVSGVCEVERSQAIAETSEPPSDSSALFSAEQIRKELDAGRAALARLREIPVPVEQRADVERYVELLATGMERYERELPRIQAASRRLDEAMKSVSPDELPPPSPEAQTVIAEIMSQLESVPAVRDAWAEQQRAFGAAISAAEDAELELLSGRLGLGRCDAERRAAQQLSAEELARCGSRGKPVTLQELVDVFRANGITLAIDTRACRDPDGVPDASNSELTEELEQSEGHILCGLEDTNAGKAVEVTKHDSDYETRLRVLNVECAIYPFSRATYAEQVAQLNKALEAVAREG